MLKKANADSSLNLKYNQDLKETFSLKTKGQNCDVRYILESLNQTQQGQTRKIIHLPSKNIQIQSQLDRAFKDIKLMNHELKRVVAKDEDCFIILNDEKPTQFECLAHVQIFAKMKVAMKTIGSIQRQFPLVIELKNVSNNESVLDIFLSME